jgi:hypothetical protein
VRLVKAILFSALVFGLFSMWSQRDYVIEAYQETPEGQQITLSGVDLAITRSTLGQSPYVIPAAPDTRVEQPPTLAFATTEDQYPVVPMVGGTTVLSGVVLGPDGPVPGATVEIQRHTADGVAFRTIAADDAGRWRATGLLGGRYRVRAWLPGALAMGSSEVAFVPDGEAKDFEFLLWGIDPSPKLELVKNNEVYLGVPATIAVVLTRPVIDDRGVVVTTPIGGSPIFVSASQNMTVLSDPTQSTDVDGVARFAIVCSALPAADVINTGVLIARADDLVQTFPMPACVLPPAPEPVVMPPAEGDPDA